MATVDRRSSCLAGQQVSHYQCQQETITFEGGRIQTSLYKKRTLTPRLFMASLSKPTTLFPSAPEALKPLVQLSRIPCQEEVQDT